jgi:hypothetical protein
LFDFFLEFSHLGDEIGKPAHGGIFAEGLAMGQGGHAADDLSRSHVAGDSGAGGNHCSVADMHVVSQSGLAAKNDA